MGSDSNIDTILETVLFNTKKKRERECVFIVDNGLKLYVICLGFHLEAEGSNW